MSRKDGMLAIAFPQHTTVPEQISFEMPFFLTHTTRTPSLPASLPRHSFRILLQACHSLFGVGLLACGVVGYAQVQQPSYKALGDKPLNGFAEPLRPNTNRPSAAINQVYAPIKKAVDEGQVPEIEMFVGESRVFPTPGVGRIAVGNGSILTAAALDNKEVILFANAVGTSSLFVWNEDGRYQRIKINIVPGDTSRFAREIAAFLSTMPKAKASIIGDKVIVEGDDLTDSDLARIDLLSTRYPQIVNFTNRLGFEQMVMMDVKVVEFPTSELRELGLKWSTVGGAAIGGIWNFGKAGNAGPFGVNIQAGGGGLPITNPDGSTTAIPVPAELNLRSFLNMGLNATLNALEQNGKTTILAQPQLSARNGSKASFLAGGEFPYTVSSISGPTIQFKPYGIKLDILPRVDRNGAIRASVDTEFSQIDASVSAAAGPALLSRKTSTEFNVRAGETIVLSGLIQRENSTSVEKVPFLGDIPILGALFRSKKFQNKETELVIFVTPTVVDSKSPGMVDRIQKTRERLEDRLGGPSYLSNPLQPEHDPARPDLPSSSQSGAAANTAAVVAAAPAAASSVTMTAIPFDNPLGSTLRVKLDGLVLRTAPSAKSEPLLQLGQGSVITVGDQDNKKMESVLWRNVVVGEISGWVANQWVEPAKLTPDFKPYTPKTVALDANGVAKPVVRNAAKPLTLAAIDSTKSYAILAKKLPVHLTPDVNSAVLLSLREQQIVRGLDIDQRGAWTAVDVDGIRGWVSAEWLQPVAIQLQ